MLFDLVQIGARHFINFRHLPVGGAIGVGMSAQISRSTAYIHAVYQKKEHGKGNTAQGQFPSSKPTAPVKVGVRKRCKKCAGICDLTISVLI